MAGAAKPRRRMGNRIKDGEVDNTEIHGLLRRLNTPTSITVGSFAGAAAASNVGAGESYLPTAGGTMIGAIAFYPKLITTTNGEIDIGKSSGDYSSRVIISPQSGLTDTLLTITGAAHSGQLLFLQGVETDTITIKDSASSGTAWATSTVYALDDIVSHGGNLYVCKLAHTSSASDEPGVGGSWTDKWFKANIETIDGTDFDLVDDDIIILMFDVTDNKWQQITTGKSGASGTFANVSLSNLVSPTLNADINMNGKNLYSSITPDGTDANDFRIVFDAHGDSDTYIGNSASADRINIVSNGVNVAAWISTGLLMGAGIDLNTFDLTLTGGDIIDAGYLSFSGTEATSGLIRLPNTSGAIKWRNLANTANAEISFGASDEFMFATPNASGYHGFWVNSTEVAQFDSGGLDMQLNQIDNLRKITTSSNTTTAGFRDTGFTADPSVPNAGDLYYNTTSNTYKFYNGSVWGALGGSTTFVGFTGDDELDMANYNIVSNTAPTGVDQFRIVWDAHDDSDTYMSNLSTAADTIRVMTNGTILAEFRPTELYVDDPLNMNQNNINWGTSSATNGLIRMINNTDLRWGAAPSDADREGIISYDVDENMDFTASGNHRFWIGDAAKLQVAEFTSSGLDLQLGSLTNTRKVTVDSSTSIAGFRDIGHTADPSSPNAGDFYYNTTSNKFRFYNGSAWGDIGTGGGVDIISEGNSNVEVVDTGSGEVHIDIDGANKWKFVGNDLRPASDALGHIGTDAIRPDFVYTDKLDIQDDGASVPTSGATQITADTGGMNLGVASTAKLYDFYFGGVSRLTIDEDTIKFTQSSHGHEIASTTTSINIVADAATDSVELWPGSARSNEGLYVSDSTSVFKSSTTGSAYQLYVRYSNGTTTGQPGIGGLGFEAEDSGNNFKAYAGIVAAIDDDTSTGRDGRLQIVVANNQTSAQGTLTDLTGIGVDVQSDNGTMKLGFFGATPVVKQNPTATANSIHTALQNYGLFV